MYAKLFASILDSSVWLEAPATRLVWLTLLAAKDEDGFARFATIDNLAVRARVMPDEADDAIRILEGPDPNSSNPDHEGRRVERVPGGWMVLNAGLYDQIAKRAQEREQVRERVKRHRAKHGSTSAVTPAPPLVSPPVWLTPICDVYERHYGAGSFPHGLAGKTLKPLHVAGHSCEEIAERLNRYIERLDDVRYFSLPKFRQTFDAYTNGAVQKASAKKSGGVGQRTYNEARKALGLTDD